MKIVPLRSRSATCAHLESNRNDSNKTDNLRFCLLIIAGRWYFHNLAAHNYKTRGTHLFLWRVLYAQRKTLPCDNKKARRKSPGFLREHLLFCLLPRHAKHKVRQGQNDFGNIGSDQKHRNPAENHKPQSRFHNLVDWRAPNSPA